MRKNQEFMLATQRMNMERQAVMQQLMQQRGMAMQLARQKDMFHWISVFGSTVSVLLLAGSIRKKKPELLIPILPLSFIIAYQFDMAYGNKMKRIKKEAEIILNEKNDCVSLPNGPVKFDEVEAFRVKR